VLVVGAALGNNEEPGEENVALIFFFREAPPSAEPQLDSTGCSGIDAS
jgi:hypothetical protein